MALHKRILIPTSKKTEVLEQLQNGMAGKLLRMKKTLERVCIAGSPGST